MKKKSKKNLRVSKSFYNAASGAKVGENIAKRIDRARGRNNALITKNTVNNWQKAGFVDIPYAKLAQEQKYKIVCLTTKGRKLLENAAAWRNK